MTRIAQVLPVVSGNPSLPQLDYAALVAAGIYVPEFERDAYADFVFDLGNANSLKSRVNTNVLTPANAAPTYSAGYLTVAAGGLNGLKSAMPDSVSQTLCFVVRRPVAPTTAAIVGGVSLGADIADGIRGGELIYFDPSGTIQLQARDPGGSRFVNAPGSSVIGAVGDWLFVAVTCEVQAGASPHLHKIYVIHGGGTVVTNSTSGTKKLATSHTVPVGNAYNTTANYAERAMLFHRAVFFPRALTSAELVALYKRCKVVAARRGITIV